MQFYLISIMISLVFGPIYDEILRFIRKRIYLRKLKLKNEAGFKDKLNNLFDVRENVPEGI